MMSFYRNILLCSSTQSPNLLLNKYYTYQQVLAPLDFDSLWSPSSSWLVAVAPPLAPPLPATAGV